MIRYALACDQGHSFETWFQNSAAYDKQAKRGLVTCPQCGSAKVEKALMTPQLSGTKKRGRMSVPALSWTRPATTNPLPSRSSTTARAAAPAWALPGSVRV